MVNSEIEPNLNDEKVFDEISNEVNKLDLNKNNEVKAMAKKKRKKKKPTTDNNDIEKDYVPDLPNHFVPLQDNSHLRKVSNWPAIVESKQTFPPTVPVNKIYKKYEYPEGEKIEYTGTNSYRIASQELKSFENNYIPDYSSLRRAAEVHRQVRKYMQSVIKPGIKLIDLCNILEDKTRELVSADSLNSGCGFPTGCSLNHCAAHYTPNPGDNTILTEDDICKLDFGVQVNGMIIDCAFSVAFKDHFDPLIQSTLDGTNTGLKLAGIDAIFSEIGSSIQEVIESYEFEYKGKTYPIKAIKNLNGHSILPYQIHGGKSLPIVATVDSTRMEENEVYAIETFASTGRGYVTEGFDCSHYMKCYDSPFINESGLRLKSARTLLSGINSHFGTLAFCRKWLDQLGFEKHALALKSLVDAEIIRPYPPLNDVVGSFTSQTEHTVILRPTCKEVVSRGCDF
ncbi:methionine aminopeptidase [Cryptosporidium ryanae]|uniref:methionine aminopeptidase n=1 Tax=Cryptosporidium ryanae TaxID=515981 RepID=UPI00351A996F|nr:methionine aminopeptidase [Cryptosporidium ryanae]